MAPFYLQYMLKTDESEAFNGLDKVYVSTKWKWERLNSDFNFKIFPRRQSKKISQPRVYFHRDKLWFAPIYRLVSYTQVIGE